jgi:hypothetical protein
MAPDRFREGFRKVGFTFAPPNNDLVQSLSQLEEAKQLIYRNRNAV